MHTNRCSAAIQYHCHSPNAADNSHGLRTVLSPRRRFATLAISLKQLTYVLNRAVASDLGAVPSPGNGIAGYLPPSDGPRIFPRKQSSYYHSDTGAKRRSFAIPTPYLVLSFVPSTSRTYKPSGTAHHFWCGCETVVWPRRRFEIQRLSQTGLCRRRKQRSPRALCLFPCIQVGTSPFIPLS